MESVQKLSAEEVQSLEDRVSVPYRVEDVTVLSPGEWNGLDWTASELKDAVEETDFEMSREDGDEMPPNGSLFYDHDDRSADQWVGQVENVRIEGDGNVKSDLVITNKQAAINLEYGAPFGVSPKADGMVNEEGVMRDFTFENFSLVVNPAVKTTWLNEDLTTVLQDMSIHTPRFDGTHTGEWNSPDLEDFTDKSYEDMSDTEKRAIGRHFLVSKSGFPAENYTDLSLPVVEPNGDLSLSALQNAKARVSQVSGIDEDEIRRVSRIINNLANGNFDADFEEVDMSKNGVLSESMPVGENDWVQWNPEEAVEAHGKVIRVIEPDSEDEQLQVDVRMYIQDDDGVWHPTGDVRRKDMDEVGPWGNTPSDDAISDERLASPVRKFDPEEDPEDVSESIRDAIENNDMEELISDDMEEAIEEKVEEHNEKHGDEDGKKVTKSMLIDVYERGMGAYQDSHRPGMSPQQWSMARVNAFLYLVRNGNPENDAYTQDNDLLPDGHPKKGETESSDENYTKVKNPMSEEQETQEAEEASEQEEESVDYVTAEELEDFKSEVIDSLQEELGDEDEADEEAEGVEDAEEVEEEASDNPELSEFEEFRQENPELSLSEAAEQFEEENRGVEDKLEEMSEKIDSLESKLESKEEEVEELSEKVSNPQRATQASGSDSESNPREEVAELSDEELHAAVFSDMLSNRGVTATKEMVHND